jgi:hypothetical protein
MRVLALIAVGVLHFASLPTAQADLVVIVNADGSSDVYQCEEDSPPPCVWVCAVMGNRQCGAS